jgi:hypothetical protein
MAFFSAKEFRVLFLAVLTFVQTKNQNNGRNEIRQRALQNTHRQN